MTAEPKPAWSQSVYINRQHKFWYRFFFNRRLNFAVKVLRPHEPHSLLDIGTGPGNSLAILRDRLNLRFAIGLDRNENFVRERSTSDFTLQNSSTRSGYVCGDIRALPFRPGSFDALSLIACIKHVFVFADALDQCCQTLKSDGLILIIEPSTCILKFASWLGYFDRRNIPNLLSCRDYARRLCNSGFASIRYGHFLFGCYQFNLARKDL